MKTRISSILILSFTFILASCANKKMETDPGREIGFLTISKEKPQPGDALELSYHSASNAGEGETEVFYHYFIGPKVCTGS